MSEETLRAIELRVSTAGGAALHDEEVLALVQEVRALRAEIQQVEGMLDEVLDERGGGGSADVETMPE